MTTIKFAALAGAAVLVGTPLSAYADWRGLRTTSGGDSGGSDGGSSDSGGGDSGGSDGGGSGCGGREPREPQGHPTAGP